MPSEIKFNNFGIPYLVEFANLSIRSKKGDKDSKLARSNSKDYKEKVYKEKPSKAPKPPPKPSTIPARPVRCPTCGHLPNHVPDHAPNHSLDQKPQTLKVPEPEKPAKAPKPGGLYIRFENSPGVATAKLSSRRLAKLRSAIEVAVTNVGMLKPGVDETGSNTGELALGGDTARSRNDAARKDTSKKALFKGTYGQVKDALKEAGLVTIPCSENGFENATRLGALFVVNSDKGTSADGLQLTKLTLWG